jgi:hypothetical protein
MELRSWERRYCTEGGGRPFLFYVVFGQFRDRLRYKCAGIPDGISTDKYHEHKHPDVRDSFREGYLWDKLCLEDPELAANTAAAPECLVIRGEPIESRTLDYLRDTIGFLAYLLDNGAVSICEVQSLKWWSPQQWWSRVYQADGPVPCWHVVILFSEEQKPGRWWCHTRGLRQFGRPDLSLHDVSEDYKEAVIDLFNRFIELQAFGGLIGEGEEIVIATLPKGMRCHHKGHIEDPDFNNVHVEIVWPKRIEE